MSTIIDNGGVGYSESGAGWTTSTGEGYGGSIRYHASGVGSTNYADWNFTGLTAGAALRVGLTWSTNPNRETAAPWTLYDSDGTTILASGTVNQQLAPADFTDAGVGWVVLATEAPTGTSLTVRIGANGPNAAEYVIADAAQVATPPPLSAGTVSWANMASATSATVSTTAASGGTSPYTYDLEVAPDVSGSAGTYAAQGLASSTTLMTATGLTTGAYYWLRQKVTDSLSATASSAGVRIKAAAASATVEFPLDASSIISIDNGFDSGSLPANVYDGDFTTYYTSATNVNPWVGIDLGSGNAAALTDIWFVPRTDNGHDSTLYNAAVECAATSGGTWSSYGSTTGYPFIEAWNHFTFSGATNRCYRIRAANSPEGYLQVAEVRFGGTFVSGLRWRPARPTLSPASGRYAAGSTVSITAPTGGAAIYYTTDGTDPAVSVVAGVLTPSGTTALYTGPISLSSSSSVQTIKAIAVHEGSTNSVSHIVPGYFRAPAKFVPDTGAAPSFSTSHIPEDWYDDRAILIEGHGGHVFYDTVTSKYYWYGFQTANPAGEPGRGVVCYSSTDLYNWHYEGPASDNATSLDATLVDITRMHVGYNSGGAADAKYVMVANLYASGYGTGYIGFGKSATPTGPFTWVAKALPGGFYPGDVALFIDPNDGTWYTVNNVNHATNLILCVMDPATGYLSYTGTTITVDSTGGEEDPALIYRNGRYWLFSGAINYGGIGGLAANSVYKSATTLAGLNAVGWTSIWPSAPASTDVANSAQLTCVFPVNGRTDSWVFMFDWWDIGEGTGTTASLNLHHARSAWFPAVAANWPTSTTFQMGTPGALSWDMSFFPAPATTLFRRTLYARAGSRGVA